MSDDGPTDTDRAREDGSNAARTASGESARRPPTAVRSSGEGQDSSGRLGESNEDSTWRLFARDLLTSALAVMLVGAYLFAVSGVWPPLVAVESESMVPNMEVNDLVFVMEETRFPGDGEIGTTGVVTAASGESVDYSKFNRPGDVIVFAPDGDGRATPIIHRAMFYVEEGERWVDRANPEYTGSVDSCEDVSSCPAEHAGFVTKGDANHGYDQVMGLRSCDGTCDPIKPDWVIGTAEVRIPGIGYLRVRA